MENVLGDIEGAECYMDDILVHADGMEEHGRRLDQALNRLAQTGLKRNREKREFRKEEISFLGHIQQKRGMPRLRRNAWPWFGLVRSLSGTW